MINIQNRRYIGSKTSLIGEIDKAIRESIIGDNYTFADIFAGTGVVAYNYALKGHKVIVNDNLYSNYVSYMSWFSNDNIDLGKINEFVNYYNNIDSNKLETNYFSNIYGNKYFSENDSKKIGFIRDDLELKKKELTEREFYYLLTSLIYATDRIANTVGHFESYLKNKKPIDYNIKIDLLDIKTIYGAKIYNEDANNLVKKIKADVVYLDPPYNARQYVNFYHVLENLARWNKPTEFEGDSMKFKRNELKSGYSRAKAPILMQDLIDNISAKLIVVSYNNTYTANSTASNNKIQETELEKILKSKGNVIKREIPYKFFNAGKTDFKEHKEYIYTCEVK